MKTAAVGMSDHAAAASNLPYKYLEERNRDRGHMKEIELKDEQIEQDDFIDRNAISSAKTG